MGRHGTLSAMETVTPGKAYWLRILPPAAQQEQFLRGTGTRRDVYSWALPWRTAYDQAHGTSPRHVDVWSSQ
jgi:hypothetical protein